MPLLGQFGGRGRGRRRLTSSQCCMQRLHEKSQRFAPAFGAKGQIATLRRRRAKAGGHAKTTLTQTAYGSLRAMILTGELQSGARLTEIELALRLKISRTPLREA